MEDPQEDFKLDPKSTQELQQFFQQEANKAKLREGKVTCLPSLLLFTSLPPPFCLLPILFSPGTLSQ